MNIWATSPVTKILHKKVHTQKWTLNLASIDRKNLVFGNIYKCPKFSVAFG